MTLVGKGLSGEPADEAAGVVEVEVGGTRMGVGSIGVFGLFEESARNVNDLSTAESNMSGNASNAPSSLSFSSPIRLNHGESIVNVSFSCGFGLFVIKK